MNQKKTGIILSYLNLIMGMVVNVFLTPFLIASLGDVDYSLYKVMHSFAGPLTMFHLGISTIVTRSIVQCQTGDGYTVADKQNTMAHALLASGVMALLVSLAGVAMYVAIPGIYGETYSAESVKMGQRIFLLFVGASVLHMLTDAFSGCLVGHEKFAVSSSVQLAKTLLKMVLWIVLLKLGMGVFWVACVDLIVAAVTFFASFGYSMLALREIPRFHFLDLKKLWEIVSFGFAVLLQAFVNQVNNNLDTMLLGAYVEEKAIITMYSSALAIYSIYNSLISVIANFFLPKATRLVTQNASGRELTDFVIAPGRFQAVLAVACILGFSLFGRNFISVWIGDKYQNAYWVTLMLMIPVTVPLVENAMISVLDAALKRIYRSVTLVIMAVGNVILSVVLIQWIGFWGAAVGTVVSLIVGHGFLMNIYYHRTFGLEIGRMFYSIFKGILPAGLLAAALCIPLALFAPNSILWFILKCGGFMALYLLFLFLFGLNGDEKRILKKSVRR